MRNVGAYLCNEMKQIVIIYTILLILITMAYKLYFFLFLIFIVSCTTKQHQHSLTLDRGYYTIYLDENREQSIPLSALFKNVRTIILETSDECVIGRLTDIQVFDGFIFILDSSSAKSLFVFNTDGKFIRKIGRFGQGPGDYNSIYDFSLDTENRIIFLCDNRNRIHKYYFDGTYIHTIKIQEPDSEAYRIQFYGGRLYLSQLWWKKAKDDLLLLEIDANDGKILSRLLPVKYNKGWNEDYSINYSRFFMSRLNNPPRYSEVFMDYIFTIYNEAYPFIELKSNFLTTETDIESFRGTDGIRRVNAENLLNSSKLYHVHSFIENDNFILFRIGRSQLVVLIEKKTGNVLLANYLNNDLIFKKDQIGKLGRFMFSDSKGAYEVFNPQYDGFINLLKSIKENETVSDLDKMNQLMNLDEESNPVIFYYEFK